MGVKGRRVEGLPARMPHATCAGDQCAWHTAAALHAKAVSKQACIWRCGCHPTGRAGLAAASRVVTRGKAGPSCTPYAYTHMGRYAGKHKGHSAPVNRQVNGMLKGRAPQLKGARRALRAPPWPPPLPAWQAHLAGVDVHRKCALPQHLLDVQLVRQPRLAGQEQLLLAAAHHLRTRVHHSVSTKAAYLQMQAVAVAGASAFEDRCTGPGGV